MAVTKISDPKDWEINVINSPVPVFVDFWAEWCGPCKQISPLLKEIAEEKESVLNVIKLNIDENPQTPLKYGVRGIPTLMLFKDGKLVDSKIGSMPKSSLTEWIESFLN